MTYEIIHQTEYRYSEPVTISNHTIHLQPRLFEDQKIVNSRITIHPKPVSIHEYSDYFANPVMFFTIEEPHLRLQIHCQSEVEVLNHLKPAPMQTMPWDSVRDSLYADFSEEGLHTIEFTHESPYVPILPGIRNYALQSFMPGRSTLDAALDLNARIHNDFVFDPTATTVSTPVADVFHNRRGVCQDFAHFMLSCFRSLGLAARYVSGYMRTYPPPGQAPVFGADASHAWTALYYPGYGWIGLDPTNNRMAEMDYVVLGWGRDYSDVSLIRGILSGGGQHSLYLSVNMAEK